MIISNLILFFRKKTFVTLRNYVTGFHSELTCFHLIFLLALTYKRDCSGSMKI